VDVSQRFSPTEGDPNGKLKIIDQNPTHASGHDYLDAVFVPPYMRPDAFPTVHGPTCTCGPTGALPSQPAVQQVACNCTGEGHDFKFVKFDPLYNSSKFTLSPADMTYSSGDYWLPHAEGSLQAPGDKLPMDGYPIQAPAEEVWLVPATARKDRLPGKFARYVDQLKYREECLNDVLSFNCTVPCRINDVVNFHAGSSQAMSKVLNLEMPDAMTIEFVPTAAEGATVPLRPVCSLQDACSIFDVCWKAGSSCMPQETHDYRDFLGNLQHIQECPPGYTLCGKIQMTVKATMLKIGDRACRPEGPMKPTLPPFDAGPPPPPPPPQFTTTPPMNYSEMTTQPPLPPPPAPPPTNPPAPPPRGPLPAPPPWEKPRWCPGCGHPEVPGFSGEPEMHPR
jgi:hypothetical protein